MSVRPLNANLGLGRIGDAVTKGVKGLLVRFKGFATSSKKSASITSGLFPSTPIGYPTPALASSMTTLPFSSLKKPIQVVSGHALAQNSGHSPGADLDEANSRPFLQPTLNKAPSVTGLNLYTFKRLPELAVVPLPDNVLAERSVEDHPVSVSSPEAAVAVSTSPALTTTKQGWILSADDSAAVTSRLLQGDLFHSDGSIILTVTTGLLKPCASTPADSSIKKLFVELVSQGFISKKGGLLRPISDLDSFRSSNVVPRGDIPSFVTNLKSALEGLNQAYQKEVAGLYAKMTEKLSPDSKAKLEKLVSGDYGLTKLGILTAFRFMEAFTPDSDKLKGKMPLTADEFIGHIEKGATLFEAFSKGKKPILGLFDSKAHDNAYLGMMWYDTALRGPQMFERGVTRFQFGEKFVNTMTEFLTDLGAKDRWSTHAKGTDNGENTNAKGLDFSGAKGQNARLVTPFGLGNTLYEPTVDSAKDRLLMLKVKELYQDGYQFRTKDSSVKTEDPTKTLLKKYYDSIYKTNGMSKSAAKALDASFETLYAAISKRIIANDNGQGVKGGLDLFAEGFGSSLPMSMVMKSEVHGLNTWGEKIRHMKGRDVAIIAGTVLGVVPGILIWGMTKLFGWGVRYNPSHQINSADKKLMKDSDGDRVKLKSKEHLSSLQTKCKSTMFASSELGISKDDSKEIFKELKDLGLISKKDKMNRDGSSSAERSAPYVINPSINIHDPKINDRLAGRLGELAQRLGLTPTEVKSFVISVLRQEVSVRVQVLRLAADLGDMGVGVDKKTRFKKLTRPHESVVTFKGKPSSFTVALQQAKAKLESNSLVTDPLKKLLALLELPLDELSLEKNQKILKDLLSPKDRFLLSTGSSQYRLISDYIFNLASDIKNPKIKSLVQRYANILMDYRNVSPGLNPLKDPVEGSELLAQRQVGADGKVTVRINGVDTGTIDEKAGLANADVEV